MKQEQSKRLTILVPETLVEQFQKKCAENYKTMSEALRDFVNYPDPKEVGASCFTHNCFISN